MKIDILSREMIKPSSPTPSHLKNFKLSILDQIAPPLFVPLILFFSSNKTNRSQKFDIYRHLRVSLSDTLSRFYPIAGRMKGESFVDCNDVGVYYIEAQVDASLCDIIERPEVDTLNQLIPYDLYDRQLAKEEQMGLKVNLFNCGGVAIGICISHRIGDACTLSTFIKAWAATARGDTNLVSPSFVSSSIYTPRSPLGFDPLVRVPEDGLVTRNFVFSASTIASLKAEVIKDLPSVKPTRVEVVSAVIWRCAIGRTGLAKPRKSMVFHSVNLRGRMVPPLPEFSFGNLIQMARAVSQDETELAELVAKLRSAFENIDSDYIAKRQGESGSEVIMSYLKDLGELLSKEELQILSFSSWCGFPIYESDFGWGNPDWVSFAGFHVKNSVFLMDSRWAGGIEVWVTMCYQDMATFEHELQTFISPFENS